MKKLPRSTLVASDAVGAIGLALIVYGTSRMSLTAAILLTGAMLFAYAYVTAK